MVNQITLHLKYFDDNCQNKNKSSIVDYIRQTLGKYLLKWVAIC